MRHDTEVVSHGSVGCPVASDVALGAGAEIRRSTCQVRTARDRRRDSLRDPQRLHVEIVAARFAAVSHCLSLFSALAAGWDLGANPRGLEMPGSTEGWPHPQAFGGHPRQPNGEDDRARRATRLRRGEKRSSAASGTWSLTRWVCSGHWSSRPLRCRIATVPEMCSLSFVGTSSSRASSGRTKRTKPSPRGPGFDGCGPLSSSFDRRGASNCSPNDGSWNARLAGSAVHADFPKATNAQPRATERSSMLP